MGNYLGTMNGELSDKANNFIFRYNKAWMRMLYLVRKARRESSNEILQEANAIIAPCIEKFGIGEDGDFDVWKELWQYIKDVTAPV